ncbi:MAG: metalloregulator ArsR/SmtB family transcription factor [Bacteroidota bacterium]
MPPLPLSANQDRVQRIAQLMRHLGHPVRFQLVQYLAEEGPRHVNDIHQQLGVSQSGASQHLKALEQLAVLQSQRIGPRVEYRVQQAAIPGLLSCAWKSVAHLSAQHKLKTLSKLLKTMGHPDRLLLVELLLEKEKLSVSEIQAQLTISQSSTSQHLKALENLGIVDVVQEGKNRFYFVIHPHIQHMIHCVGACTDC